MALLGGVWLDWLVSSLPTKGVYDSRPLSDVQLIVVHHSGQVGGGDCDAWTIAEYHVQHNGWPGIGYHVLVHPSGHVELVNLLSTVSYHCGLMNRSSVGVCLVGNFDLAAPSHNQTMRAHMVCEGIRRELHRPDLPIRGHGELSRVATGYAPTSCPGRTWPLWKPLLTGVVGVGV